MAHEVLTTYEEELLALHDTLDILSGKWKMQIVALLCNGEFRYSELKAAIPKITPRMLSKELKALEQHQLITRTVYDTTPVQVTYQLTEYGETLVPLIIALVEWGQEHRKKTAKEDLVAYST